jgi:murein DD-endopeptidase MepM/ murein hydrolase activator NlpD
MRELSGEQRTERGVYPDAGTEALPIRGRGWLWHGVAALGISALGLAVAAAVGLMTNAQTTEDLCAVQDLSPTVATVPVRTVEEQSATKDPALAVFSRRTSANDRSSRNAAVKDALVRAQAAQRDELLAKTAEEISRAAQSASSDARQQELEVAERSTREAAVQIAAEHLRRAIAARVAAANKRQAAERQSSGSEVGSANSDKGSGDSAGDSGGNGRSDQGGRNGNSDSGSSGSAGSDGGGSGGGGSGGGGVAPVPGAVIGAHFGEYGSWSRYHTGIDFRAGHGTPIRAVRAGVVLYAGNSGNWAGNHVAIKHADGMTTMSSHMSSMAVRAGQTVGAGQVIGYVGQTGRAFGAHLHFELYPAGVKYGDVYSAINPQPWLAASGVTTR